MKVKGSTMCESYISYQPRHILPVVSSSNPGLLHSHLKLPTTLTQVPPTHGDDTHSSMSTII